MKTIWGERLNPEAILPEYPRPQMRRESYLCLNGRWRYAFSKGEDMPLKMEGEILVPFSPESPLSGVGRALRRGSGCGTGGSLHCQRALTRAGCCCISAGWTSGPRYS